VLPTPASWNEITDPANPAPIPVTGPQEVSVVGPITWKRDKIPGEGHYCFIALIDTAIDPAPDPASITTPNEYHRYIRESNNATWKNFRVTDIIEDSYHPVSFSVQGWPRTRLSADLVIDLSPLVTGMTVTMRIVKRLSAEARLENATLLRESERYQYFQLAEGKKAVLHNLNLEPSDQCKVTLEVAIPEHAQHGSYRITAAEIVDGKEMGTVTELITVGQFPYIGNSHTHELHHAQCEWAARISRRNKVAMKDMEKALAHGYDGCHYCLPEYSKD
jgi:zinc metalloprotease ZmpB